MKQTFKKLTTVFIMLCLLLSVMPEMLTVTATDVGLPALYDIKLQGTPVIGQTLTLSFDINNPTGSFDDITDTVKWYKQGSKYYRRNDDNAALNSDSAANLLHEGGMTYTIPDDESLVGKYISVTILSSGNARVRTVGIGPIAVQKTDDMIADSVKIYSDNTNSTGSCVDQSITAYYIEPDGDYRKQWYACDTEDGTYIPIEGASENSYTPDYTQYKKFLKFAVIPVTNGVDGTPWYSENIVLVGNAAFGGYTSGSHSVYAGCAVNGLTDGLNSGGSRLYTYTSASGMHYVTVDLGKTTDITGIKLDLYNVDNDHCLVEYSLTGEEGSWQTAVPKTPKEGVENGFPLSDGFAEFDAVYTARYVKVNYTHHKNLEFYEIGILEKEDRPPVLTLLGEETVRILRGEIYTESGYTAIDDGVDITTNVSVSGSVNTNVAGEYELTYSVTDTATVPHTVTVTRKVIVADGFQKDGDIAYHKPVTADSGLTPQNINDGNMYTSWECSQGINNAVVDFGEETLVSKFEISETGSDLSAFKLYASKNGTEYVCIYTSETVGDITYDIEPVSARYLKIEVNSASGVGKLNSFSCWFDELGKVKRAAQLLSIDANLEQVVEDLPLPDSGEYGTVITWTSSNNNVVGNNGAVTRKNLDTSLTLTATVALGDITATRTFNVTVLEKEQESSSSGGGGSYGGRGGVSIPKPAPIVVDPVINEDIKKDAFSDVSNSHWAYEYVELLAEKEIIGGFEDGTFAPDSQITRAQFLKMILDVLNLSKTGTVEFTDVASTDWYYKYVNTAYTLGIVNGIGDNKFGADLPIKRQDMAVIISKALNCTGMPTDVTDNIDFTDKSEISEYAKASISWVNGLNIMTGNPQGEFKPHNSATRAEAAKIIAVLLELKGGS